MKHTTLSLALFTLALGAACGDDATRPSTPQGPLGGDDRPAEEGDGEDTSGEDTDGEDGTTVIHEPESVLVAPWSSYCTATATRTFLAEDMFGDPTYAVKEGEEFVLSNVVEPQLFKLIALIDAGPVPFYVELEGGDMPFDLSCDVNRIMNKIGVFSDVKLYLDQALTEQACSLEAGTIVEVVDGDGGFAPTDEPELGFSTFRFYLNGLSSKCGGHKEVYARVPSVEVDGIRHDLVPIHGIAVLAD